MSKTKKNFKMKAFGRQPCLKTKDKKMEAFLLSNKGSKASGKCLKDIYYNKEYK